MADRETHHARNTTPDGGAGGPFPPADAPGTALWLLARGLWPVVISTPGDPRCSCQADASCNRSISRRSSSAAASIAANPLEQGRAHAARREWEEAADRYTRALKRGATDEGHLRFEYAAVLLLSGDRPGYANACAHMVERCGRAPGLRAYHVARACTLAPDAIAEASLPGRLAEAELKATGGQFWSLTEQGALHYRAGRFPQALALFKQSLPADPTPGRAVLNWLRLALAQQRFGGAAEARRWLGTATTWLDQYRDGMPDRAEAELGLHLHNWLKAHVLRREAEALIRPAEQR